MWYTIDGQDLKPEDQLVNVKELNQKITETKEDIDNNYVKKEEGKGLSTNDYTNQEKNKLFGLDTYQIIIDDNVYNLTSSSTSQEIIDAFGGEEAFTKMLNDIRAGKKVAMILYKDASGTYKLYPVYLSYWENNKKSGLSLVEYFQGAYREIGFDCSNNIWRVSNEAENYELVNSEDVLLKNNNNPYTPTSNYQPATKKYVDDAIASAGGSDDSIFEYYITDTISTGSPFILEGRKPGIYWLPNVSGSTTLYMKGTASNRTYFVKGIYGPLHIVKEYTTASDNEVVALYQSNVGTYFSVLKSSSDSSGLTRGTKINDYFDLVGTNGTQDLTNQFNFTSLIPKITSSTSPTEDTHIVTKGYVDNAVANAGSSGAIVTYIEDNSSSNPFIFEEHEPGMYVFKNQPYVKARTSNTVTKLIRTVDNTIYLLKKPLADDPDDTLLACFMNNVLDIGTIRLFSTFDSGMSFHYSTNTRGFVQINSTETIGGTKTFTNLPKLVAEKTPTDNLELVPKKYVDDNLPVFFIEDTFSLNNPFILEGKKPGIYNIFSPNTSQKATMLYLKGTTSNTTTLQRGLYGAFVIVRDYGSAPANSLVAMYMEGNLSYYKILKKPTNSSGLTLGGPINNYSNLITSNGNSEITGLYKFTSDIPQITSTSSPSLDQHIVTKKYVDDAIAAALGSNN